MPSAHRLLGPCLALAALLLAQSASAGPLLICHPFVTDGAPSLPWSGGPDWHAPDRHYDVRHLTADTLALLGPDAPIVARMETLRRATIYAAGDPQASADLLRALLARTRTRSSDPRETALASFDAGYLIESYRQHFVVDKVDMLAAYERGGPPLDGYALVAKAIALSPTDAAAMELAASLMAPDHAASKRHREAAAAAGPSSLVAANIRAIFGS
jgi:hypothetical protein